MATRCALAAAMALLVAGCTQRHTGAARVPLRYQASREVFDAWKDQINNVVNTAAKEGRVYAAA